MTTGSPKPSSKKPSSSKPLPNPVFFTDRDLGHLLPETLRERGLTVERHDDHFGPLTPDVEWLEEVGRKGWVALSHNKQIRYNSEERDMVMRARVPLFLLIGKHSHPVLAQNLIQTIPKLLRFLGTHRPPFIARIYRAREDLFFAGAPGRVQLWLSHQDWLGRKRP